MIENRARAFTVALIGAVLVVGSPVATLAAAADSKVTPTASKDKKKKDDDKKQASERKRHDNGQKHDGKKDGDDKDEWKHKDHKDKHNKGWDHDRDKQRRHRYRWDTHRRYYEHGYYGPGYYDDCGYYGSNYDGYNSYYGPDACRYEYGGYGSHFLVDMSWDQVLPDPGPRDAFGTANLDVDVPAGVVCFRLAYDGIDRPIGAQIHPGRIGEVGPAVVLLQVGQNGDDGCVSADPQILSEMQNDPRGYYLEVNDEHHGQAMRGQLDAPDYRGRYEPGAEGPRQPSLSGRFIGDLPRRGRATCASQQLPQAPTWCRWPDRLGSGAGWAVAGPSTREVPWVSVEITPAPSSPDLDRG